MSGIGGLPPVNPTAGFPESQPLKGWNYKAYGDIEWPLQNAEAIAQMMNNPQVNQALAKLKAAYLAVTQDPKPPPSIEACEKLVDAMNSFVKVVQNQDFGSDNLSQINYDIGQIQEGAKSFQAWVEGGRQKWTPPS